MFYLCHSQSLLCSELPNIVGLPRLQKKWVPGADQLNWQHAHVPVRVVAWQPEMATNCCCGILLGGLSGRAEVSSQPLGEAAGVSLSTDTNIGWGQSGAGASGLLTKQEDDTPASTVNGLGYFCFYFGHWAGVGTHSVVGRALAVLAQGTVTPLTAPLETWPGSQPYSLQSWYLGPNNKIP